ncbi:MULTISPECIES: flavin reductase family protein [unclassified Brachybacterium]|uniref:flavin reductase family protein n=1 Tax=unclassified Brachybacterium TaxID=2623841 RepID=UPI003619F92B
MTPTAAPKQHFYEPASGTGLPHSPFNAIIAPRPIGWISSRSADGVLNLAPYSFFNAFCYTPPIIGFSSSGTKDTLTNIEATGEFCWNLVSRELAEAMNVTSAPAPPEVDEFELAGLTPAPSRVVSVPHVAESRTVFECRLTQIVTLQAASGAATENRVVFGEVVGVHIAEALLAGGIYQTAKAEPVVRGGGPSTYFAIDEDLRFDMWRPGPDGRPPS